MDVEIAKLKKSLSDQEEIESVIKELLEAGELTSNSIISVPNEKNPKLNKFKDSISSISINIPVAVSFLQH